MARARSSRLKKRKPPPRSKTYVLDQFSERDLEFWNTRTIEMQTYADRVYFDLERQRVKNYDALCAALRTMPPEPIGVDQWVRVTDWQWSMTPLSPAGSIKGIGQRFNIGRELDRARGQAFPSLYIACDEDTAYREYFGGPLASSFGRMTRGDLALRSTASFTTFSLRGRVEQVFDARTPGNLKPFLKIISRFEVSTDTRRYASAMRLPHRPLLRKTEDLWKRLVAAPSSWRTEPQMSGIPAASQLFGRFVRDAGFEAVLYLSQKGGRECLAVFPENFPRSESCIEVSGKAPVAAICTRMDKDNPCLEGI